MAAKAKRRRMEHSGESSAASETAPAIWDNKTVRWSLLSAVAIWLAFPPVGIWPLAWIAPYGWLKLIRMPQLEGKRPQRTIYFVGYLHWLLMTHWVTLPHWSAAIGWLFLAAYLAVYHWGFITLARWLVHRARWSIVLAAPSAWVAMEVARSYLLTGFALVPLSHTQVDFIPVLQLSNVVGAYGLSFLIMLVAAALERTISSYFSTESKTNWWPVGIAGTVFSAALAYGFWSMNIMPVSDREAVVAIIQGSQDTEFGDDPAIIARGEQSYNQYIRMTADVTRNANIDLVVWPESMFRVRILKYDEELAAVRPDEASYTFGESAEFYDVQAIKILRPFGTPSLMGTRTDYCHRDSFDRYNTAALYDSRGMLRDSYYKMHPVMFGEYVPFGDVFPWIYRVMVIPDGLSAGTEPKSFPAGEIYLAPNICFENTVPHLIRRQVLELDKRGQPIDGLVTLTNDGWFWGSSLLDVHLACGIFRAVENQKPMLIAANTGFSAHIGPAGRVLKKGPRRASDVLVARVRGSEGLSVYTRTGDWFAGCCVLFAIAGVAFGFFRPSGVRN